MPLVVAKEFWWVVCLCLFSWIWFFKMIYLLNRASKFWIIFTIVFLASRSSKLDQMLIYFDKPFLKEIFLLNCASKHTKVVFIIFLGTRLCFTLKHIYASCTSTTMFHAEAHLCASLFRKAQLWFHVRSTTMLHAEALLGLNPKLKSWFFFFQQTHKNPQKTKKNQTDVRPACAWQRWSTPR